jgi:hypothetical protein
MCPICRKNGGLLPLCDKYKFINGIHHSKTNNIANICNMKLKNGKGLCKYKSCNIDGNHFCGLHKNLWNTTSIVDNNIPIINNNDIPIIDNTSKEISLLNPNKLAHECGMKLKNGNGYCKASSKAIYNGLCGRHCIKKKEPNTKNTENTDNNFIVI